jgi:hypothetical protein
MSPSLSQQYGQFVSRPDRWAGWHGFCFAFADARLKQNKSRQHYEFLIFFRVAPRLLGELRAGAMRLFGKRPKKRKAAKVGHAGIAPDP